MRRLAIILLLCSPLFAQNWVGHTEIGAAAPTGSCAPGQITIDSVGQKLYICPSGGTWGAAAIASGIGECSGFPGADDGIKLQACMVALYALNHVSGIADARGMTGGTWSVNPFAAASIPTSGTLLMPPGTVTSLYGPIVAAMNWKIEGITPNANTGVNYGIGGIPTGSTLLSHASTFAAANYTTGTVTMGTPGQSEIVTGVGTSWANNFTTHTGTDIAPGCVFISPGGGHTDNMSYGVVHSITDGTHIVLGFGVNYGTGAPGGSTYNIICPVYVPGDGYNPVDNVGWQYGMAAEDMSFDANSRQYMSYWNLYGSQHTYLRNVAAYNFCGVGIVVEGLYTENSGPYEQLGSYAGTCGTTSTIGYWFQSPGGMMSVHDLSVNNGISGSNVAVGVEINGTGISVSHVDTEQVTTGISMNDGRACSPACAWPGLGNQGPATDIEIDGVQNNSATTAVNIGNNPSAPHDVVIHNINGGSGTNVVVDAANSCTVPKTGFNNVGLYVLDNIGNIAFNSAEGPGQACKPPYTHNVGTSDFTSANSASLQAITGLSFPLGSNSTSYRFHCSLQYSQATNVAGDQFGVGVITTAPTSVNTFGTAYTNTGAAAPVSTGILNGLASTTPTAVVTFQPAVTTVLGATLDGTIETAGSGAATFKVYVLNGTAADVIVVKRGSYCTLDH